MLKNSDHFIIKAPVKGRVIALKNLPDEVFAGGMVGNGIAIEPLEDVFLSPICGYIEEIFPTGHAFLLRSMEGVNLLIHIGIDTVKLNGCGFDVLVNKNAKIKEGDPLVKIDLEFIKREAKSSFTPLVLPDGQIPVILVREGAIVDRGQQLMAVKRTVPLAGLF